MTKKLKGIQEFIDTYAPMMYAQGHVCKDEDGMCLYTKDSSHCFIGFAIHQYLNPKMEYGSVGYDMVVISALLESGHMSEDAPEEEIDQWQKLQACHDAILADDSEDFKKRFVASLENFCNIYGYKMPNL